MTIWLAAIVVLIGVLLYVLRRSTRQAGQRCPEGKGLYPECLYVVTVSGDQLVVKRPDDSVSRLSLEELREVVVETNDSGPADADVWWHLFGSASEAVCSYPVGATGESVAIAFLQTLPGFDNLTFIEAMGCAINKRFVVYRAPSHTPP